MSFQLLGLPVEIQGTFWLTALLFAFVRQNPTPQGVTASVVVIFVAVLVHELGHALVGRWLGARPQIVLHGFGGKTVIEGKALSRGRSVLMTLAGPFAGFLLGALVLLVERATGVKGFWKDVLQQAEWCTFGWGIMNLMPVLPLDGGLVMRDALGPKHGRLVLILSAFFGAVLTVFFFKLRLPFVGVLFGMSTYQSARAAMAYGDYEAELKAREETARQRLAAARRSLEEGRLSDALLKAGEAMVLTADPGTRDGARRVAVVAAIHEGNGQRALDILSHVEEASGSDDVLRAQALDLLGERDAGFVLLRSRVEVDPSGPALEALLRGLMATEQVPEALELARALELKGSIEALEWLASELRERGEGEGGAHLFDVLYRRTGDARFEQEALRAREGLRAVGG